METVLVGTFVNLRPLSVEDAERTFLWRSNERAGNLNRGVATLELQREWISSRPSSEYNFIIELKTGQPVGMLSLVGIDKVHRHAEPGRFLIGEEDLVRGIPAAIEAIKLVYEFAFYQLGMFRVHGTIASDNKFMLKWQLFLGMKEEGRLRNHYFINGHFQDALCLGLLEDEFRNISLPRMRVLLNSAKLAHPADPKGRP